MGGIDVWQLLIIAIIVILLFGVEKLGSTGSDLGASIRGFKKVMSGDEPRQDKTSQDVDFTARTTANKQAGTNQEQTRTENAERRDRGQAQSVSGIGFNKLLLVFIIGLVVLGPQRLPVAVKAVAGWIHALRSLTIAVQNGLTQKLKLQKFQDSLKRVEETSLINLTSGLKASMDELCQAVESMERPYVANDPEEANNETHTVHNPVMRDNEIVHEGITPAAAQAQTNSPEQKPETTSELVAKPAADVEPKATALSPSSSGKS